MEEEFQLRIIRIAVLLVKYAKCVMLTIKNLCFLLFLHLLSAKKRSSVIPDEHQRSWTHLKNNSIVQHEALFLKMLFCIAFSRIAEKKSRKDVLVQDYHYIKSVLLMQ